MQPTYSDVGEETEYGGSEGAGVDVREHDGTMRIPERPTWQVVDGEAKRAR